MNASEKLASDILQTDLKLHPGTAKNLIEALIQASIERITTAQAKVATPASPVPFDQQRAKLGLPRKDRM
jgi:hypothetical protein